MRRRKRVRQQELWIPADQLDVPRHVFYDALNRLLADGGFDDMAEDLCRPYYAAQVGRSSIPPGVYFRMLVIGYFEGLDSQRGIAWRCADSLSLRTFLGYGPAEATPDHSSLTRIRDRLPLDVHTAVFQFVLGLAAEHKLLKGKTVGVDATTLEANAAMKSIVRRDSGEDWKAYLKRLMQAEGVIGEDEEPTDEDLRRFDKGRKDKKVSNAEWQSPTDPDSRIAKMKDGRTHLAYKTEHVIDLESEFLVEAAIYTADQSDGDTLLVSVAGAQQHLDAAGAATEIEEVAADKGYHKNKMLADCAECGLRTYVPVPQLRGQRRWTDKPLEEELAYRANRRRTKGVRSRRLQRLRSERVERSFAHLCETGGARRTWLRGLEKVMKRYKVVAAARNLGLLMLKLFGIGKPRGLQGAGGAFSGAWNACALALRLVGTALFALDGFKPVRSPDKHRMREIALAI